MLSVVLVTPCLRKNKTEEKGSAQTDQDGSTWKIELNGSARVHLQEAGYPLLFSVHGIKQTGNKSRGKASPCCVWVCCGSPCTQMSKVFMC